MKTIAIALFMGACTIQVIGQVPHRPESIIWDHSHQRYLISNHGDGTDGSIITYDPYADEYALFNQGQTVGPKGLAIYQNTLYVSDNGFVNGFDLDTKQRVFFKEIGSMWINDMVVDDQGFLYLGERDPGIVHKINLQTGQSEEWIKDESLFEVNGLFLDPENQRIIACFTRENSPIIAFDLETAEQSVLTTTTRTMLDGIARDHCGYYYISCHGSQCILKFDPDFGQPPEVIFDDFNGPADISYNPDLQLLCIPEIEGSQILFRELFQDCMPPVLTYPEDQQSEVPVNLLTLTWQPVVRADYYRFELALDPAFTHMVQVDGTGSTEYSIDQLEAQTQYYWRVNAYWNNQHTDYSVPFTFTTEVSSQVCLGSLPDRVRIYPNPAQNWVTIEWDGCEPGLVRLFSTQGTELLRESLNTGISGSHRLDLSDLPAGTYFIQLIEDDTFSQHCIQLMR